MLLYTLVTIASRTATLHFGLTRTFCRSSIDSDYGKSMRCSAEKAAGQPLASKHFSRNQILHHGVEILRDRSAEPTDCPRAGWYIPLLLPGSQSVLVRRSSPR
jgi:hypothetical protein